MLKKIPLILAGIVVVFLVVASFQSSELGVARSVVISARASAIIPHVENFHKWQAWSPWETIDPDLKRVFEGPESGVGAIYRWDGNNDVGAGSMTLIDLIPDRKIGIKLEFIRPFPGENEVLFLFEEFEGQTKVTWAFSGKKNFVSKCFGLICDMDAMIGDVYAEGLNNLKSVVENQEGRNS
ncbi:MAG TPA: SRPBCC family protein [Kiritimatiellia bacterium]|nr:SRPBCC family protein [Kiritimatiellia bacterium]